VTTLTNAIGSVAHEEADAANGRDAGVSLLRDLTMSSLIMNRSQNAVGQLYRWGLRRYNPLGVPT
jgi:hypothetical protein